MASKRKRTNSPPTSSKSRSKVSKTAKNIEDLGIGNSSSLIVEDISKAMSDGNDYSDVESFSAKASDQPSTQKIDAECGEMSQTQDSVASDLEWYVDHELSLNVITNDLSSNPFS